MNPRHQKQLFWNVKAHNWGRKVEQFFRRRIKDCIRNYAGKKHLSLGAGQLQYVKNQYVLDISPKMLAKNKAKHKVVADLERKLPFEKQSFDSVDAVFVMNYIENLSQLVKEIRRILRKKGKVVMVNSLDKVKDLSSLMEITPGKKNIARIEKLMKKNRFSQLEHNRMQYHGKSVWMGVYQKR